MHSASRVLLVLPLFACQRHIYSLLLAISNKYGIVTLRFARRFRLGNCSICLLSLMPNSAIFNQFASCCCPSRFFLSVSRPLRRPDLPFCHQLSPARRTAIVPQSQTWRVSASALGVPANGCANASRNGRCNA